MNDIQELVNTFEYAREVASIKKCSVNSLKRTLSFEMSDIRLLKTENENLRSDFSSLRTKHENVIQENVLLKKQNDLLCRKDRKVIN